MSESNGLPDAYRATALPSELIQRKFGCGAPDSNWEFSAYETDEITISLARKYLVDVSRVERLVPEGTDLQSVRLPITGYTSLIWRKR